jgi:hypothetical protein
VPIDGSDSRKDVLGSVVISDGERLWDECSDGNFCPAYAAFIDPDLEML